MSTLDAALKCFERDFRNGLLPDPVRYVPPTTPDPLGVLLELVHSDIELKLRSGQRARLAEWVVKCPQLLERADDLVPILETELRLRSRRGESPALDRYRASLPGLGDRVRKAFRAVDLPTADLPGFVHVVPVARGGMGEVFRATRADGTVVAVKRVRGDHLKNPVAVARFRQEAKALRSVNHPNVVKLLSTGQHGDEAYLVMEWIDGPSLQRRIVDTGPLGWLSAAVLVRKVAEAVQESHRNNVIHRDLKPDNILIVGDEPKLIDFGLAKPTVAADVQTSHGVMLGTPEYMPPEQTDGATKPSIASDVYGLGAVLYACLTGQPPLTRSEALARLGSDVVPQPVVPIRHRRPEVPHQLARIVMRCLEIEPDRRYSSAADVAQRLRKVEVVAGGSAPSFSLSQLLAGLAF